MRSITQRPLDLFSQYYYITKIPPVRPNIVPPWDFQKTGKLPTFSPLTIPFQRKTQQIPNFYLTIDTCQSPFFTIFDRCYQPAARTPPCHPERAQASRRIFAPSILPGFLHSLSLGRNDTAGRMRRGVIPALRHLSMAPQQGNDPTQICMLHSGLPPYNHMACIEKEASAFRRCLFQAYQLLQGLLNSNSHGNGHTDHGVVTCCIVPSYRAYRSSFCWFVVQNEGISVDYAFKITPPTTALFAHLVAKVVA